MKNGIYHNEKENSIQSKIKILKCIKCNSIPYLQFYKDYISYNYVCKILVKCKCNKFETFNFDELNNFYSIIDISSNKAKKNKSCDILKDNIYEKIKERYEKAKEKINKIKILVDKAINFLKEKINSIQELYNENIKLNQKILDIIQVLFNTYENYSLESKTDIEILNQNIINNTNFNLSFNKKKDLMENILDNLENNLKDSILNISDDKCFLQPIKAIKINIGCSSNNKKIMILPNKKLFIISNNYKTDYLSYVCLNPEKNFQIEFKNQINQSIDFDESFFVEHKNLFLYKNNDELYYILNIYKGELFEYNSYYNNYINLNNGNIFGFKDKEYGIINQEGKSLCKNHDLKYSISSGLMLSNNYLFLIKYIPEKHKLKKLVLLDPVSLIEIKNKIFENYLDDRISNINNKILLYHYNIYIFNYDFCFESIIKLSSGLENISFFDNYYISSEYSYIY